MIIWVRGHSHICVVTSVFLSKCILFKKLTWKCLRVQQWDWVPARFRRGKREYRHPFCFLWQHWQMNMQQPPCFLVLSTMQSQEELWGHEQHSLQVPDSGWQQLSISSWQGTSMISTFPAFPWFSKNLNHVLNLFMFKIPVKSNKSKSIPAFQVNYQCREMLLKYQLSTGLPNCMLSHSLMALSQGSSPAPVYPNTHFLLIFLFYALMLIS